MCDRIGVLEALGRVFEGTILGHFVDGVGKGKVGCLQDVLG